MKNPKSWLRAILLAAMAAMLLSCGGGGGGGGSAVGLSIGTGSGSGSTGSPGTGTGSTGGGDSPAGNGGVGGTGGTGGTGGSTGGSTGGDGTSTAGNGTGDGGVGSGGTGVSTADATGVGAVGGIGSVILNGVRYNTDAASFSLEDTAELQIGMSVRITGRIDGDFTAATAQTVTSAAELRGAVSAIDLAAGSFKVMGITVTTDNATVWGDATGLAQAVDGAVVQVWGLPDAPGMLRATRIDLRPALAAPLVTNTVKNLDRAAKTFTLGQLTVRYGAAVFEGGLNETTLAEDTIVRVRGSTAPAPGVFGFDATRIQGWYAVPTQNAAAVQLAGVVSNYGGLGSLTVLGTRVDASAAIVAGGPAASIGNGVKVEVDGFIANGVLVAKKLRIRHVPGTGGPVDFTLIGPVSGYHPPSTAFRVNGQRVDTNDSLIVFEGGSRSDLNNGRRVRVDGDRVVEGVLIARRVVFE